MEEYAQISAEDTSAAAHKADAADESEMTPDELAELCLSRATSYGLLARLFREEISEELLKELQEMSYPVETGNTLMDEGYYEIAKYLSNAWVDPLMELSIDHSKVFLGAGIDAHSAAYPYESVYTSEKRLLMQDARDEVLAIYRANGLSKAQTWKVGEDHIAVELEFMRIMNKRAATALEDDDLDKAFSRINTQHNFLEDHLATWVPVFTEDMRRFSDTLFYHGLANLTEGFLEADRELLAGLVGEDDASDEQ